MTMTIDLRIGGPGRPRLPLRLRAKDRDHTPHHLRPTDLALAVLDLDMVFSSKGRWLELRVEEEYVKSGVGPKAGRSVTKVISTTFKDEELRNLCNFFAAIAEAMGEEGQDNGAA